MPRQMAQSSARQDRGDSRQGSQPEVGRKASAVAPGLGDSGNLASALSGGQNARQEKPGPVAVPIPPEPEYGSTFSYAYGGERALSGANARWEGNRTVNASAVQRGDRWFVNLDQCDYNATYWLNSGATWNQIQDFPGGSYRDDFNMPEGSRRHEIAELEGIRALWNTFEQSLRAGIAQGFATRAEAEANYSTVYSAAQAVYRPAQQAISNHSNPLGPDAEWAYYQREYAAWQQRQGQQRRQN